MRFIYAHGARSAPLTALCSTGASSDVASGLPWLGYGLDEGPVSKLSLLEGRKCLRTPKSVRGPIGKRWLRKTRRPRSDTRPQARRSKQRRLLAHLPTVRRRPESPRAARARARARCAQHHQPLVYLVCRALTCANAPRWAFLHRRPFAAAGEVAVNYLS